MKAKWIHDCDQCKYTGSMFHHNDILDWYVCNDSVIARRGNDGPEYWSMPISMAKDDGYLMSRDVHDFRALNDMQILAQAMLKRVG